MKNNIDKLKQLGADIHPTKGECMYDFLKKSVILNHFLIAQNKDDKFTELDEKMAKLDTEFLVGTVVHEDKFFKKMSKNGR